MGGKSSSSEKVNNFLQQYEIIQQIPTQNIRFLQGKVSGEEYLLREFSFNDNKEYERTLAELTPLKLKLGSCKHLVHLKECLTTTEDQYCSTFYKIYALLEYPQRTLDDEISERNLQRRKFLETELWSILASCILALSHLQKQNLKHCALQSKYILLSQEGIIKIGLPFATGHASNYQTALTKRSTPHLYLAPEQAAALAQEIIVPSLNTFKADIWTMGMVMLEAGLLEYQDECYRDEGSRIHWETLQYNVNRLGQVYSQEFKSMVELMLSRDERIRPDWVELEEHVIKGEDGRRNHQSPTKTVSVEPPSSGRVHTEQSPPQSRRDGYHPYQSGGMSFRPQSPPQQNEQFPIIKPSIIDNIRPLRNVFPSWQYQRKTKVDDNLITMEQEDQSEPSRRQPNPTFNQPFTLLNNERSQPRIARQQEYGSGVGNEENKYVVETFKLGSKYEGYKHNGMRHGFGKFYYQDGGMYEGHWNQNKMEGFGRLYYQSGKLAYQGEWKCDQFMGKGILYNQFPQQLQASFDYSDFDVIDEYWVKYEGYFLNDLKNGSGSFFLSNGEKFEGAFLDDAVHGEGKFYKLNGEVVTGRWQNNKIVY